MEQEQMEPEQMEPEQQGENPERRTDKKPPTALILLPALILLLAAGLAAAGTISRHTGKSRGTAAEPARSVEEHKEAAGAAPEEEDTSWFTEAGRVLESADTPVETVLPEPGEPEPEGRSVEDKGVEGTAALKEPVKVQDITIFPDETAVFQCYEPGATQYQWEFYSALDKAWEAADRKPVLTAGTRTDSLGRQASTLQVPGNKENELLNVRCTAFLPEGETAVSEGSLHLFEGTIREITVAPMEAEAGEYLPGSLLRVTVQGEQAEETELTGLQALVFCISQKEEESAVYDEENSLTTETYTKVSREVPYYLVAEGEQTVPVKLRIKERTYSAQAVITGRDTRAPVFEEARADYVVSGRETGGTTVKLYARATDSHSLPSELSYAFGETPGAAESGLEWTDTLPLEAEVRKNGTYYLFARDKAGNTSHEELEIITVDMKPPVIEALTYHENAKEGAGWIEVSATDKTAMEYRFHPAGSSGGSWQEEPAYPVSHGGDYVAEVRDAAGNLSEGTITVPPMDTRAPVITGIEVMEEWKP